MNRFRTSSRRRRVRALSLMEVMVAVALLGMVFLAVAFIQSVTARQVRSLYADARTLHRAHLVMERIIFNLCMAQLGSAQVLDSGRTVEYYNPMSGPNPGTPISRMAFNNADGYIYYYKDKTQTDEDHRTGQVHDVTFEVIESGKAIRVNVTTLERHTWKLDRPYTLSTVITLRN